MRGDDQRDEWAASGAATLAAASKRREAGEALSVDAPSAAVRCEAEFAEKCPGIRPGERTSEFMARIQRSTCADAKMTPDEMKERTREFLMTIGAPVDLRPGGLAYVAQIDPSEQTDESRPVLIGGVGAHALRVLLGKTGEEIKPMDAERASKFSAADILVAANGNHHAVEQVGRWLNALGYEAPCADFRPGAITYVEHEQLMDSALVAAAMPDGAVESMQAELQRRREAAELAGRDGRGAAALKRTLDELNRQDMQAPVTTLPIPDGPVVAMCMHDHLLYVATANTVHVFDTAPAMAYDPKPFDP